MEEVKDRYVQQCGSSTVEPAFKATCERVTNLMAEKFSIHIYPKGNPEQIKNDPFGRLYIGGFKKLSDKDQTIPVTAALYLETFLSNLEDLSLDQKTLLEFNELCGIFLTTLCSPTREVNVTEIRDL